MKCQNVNLFLLYVWKLFCFESEDHNLPVNSSLSASTQSLADFPEIRIVAVLHKARCSVTGFIYCKVSTTGYHKTAGQMDTTENNCQICTKFLVWGFFLFFSFCELMDVASYFGL